MIMKDPVCLMSVDLREAGAMSIYQGRAYYFCSAACKKQFITDPEKLVDKLITAYEEQHFRKPSCFCSEP